jgi:hypothetical protein
MLSNENFEESKSGLLVIKDFSADVIRQLLKFIYTFSLAEISKEIVCDLYRAADKVTKFLSFKNSPKIKYFLPIVWIGSFARSDRRNFAGKNLFE